MIDRNAGRQFAIFFLLVIATVTLILIPFAIVIVTALGEAAAQEALVRNMLSSSTSYWSLPYIFCISAMAACLAHFSDELVRDVFLPLISYAVYMLPTVFVSSYIPFVSYGIWDCSAYLLVMSLPPYFLLRWLLAKHVKLSNAILERAAFFAPTLVTYVLMALVGSTASRTVLRFYG